ncbi:MAG: tetratricopeptide repeat protein [Candidatus Limnocylindrales bacterium]
MDDVYDRYREALRLGHHHAAEGKFAEALTQYQSAASLAGERALPHVGIGGMLLRLGRAKEALGAYERAVAIEPTNLDALSGRAAALLAAGRRDEAAKVQQQIADVRSGNLPTTAATGPDATPMSAADAMHAAGEQALQAGNNDAAIDAWLAESAEHASADRLDAALDASLRALSVDPGAPRIHLDLTRLYFKRGWVDKGVERALLLARLLDLDTDLKVEAALRALAADNLAADERLAPLANQPG